MTDSPSANASCPMIAVLGQPNEGKSSVLSTLTEDDRVGISDTPGETVICREFPVEIDGKVLLTLVDTPGFQHPRAVHDWFAENEGPEVNLPEKFIQAHQSQEKFAHDCELLKPLAKGAGVLYVINAARPVGRNDKYQMELLRLARNPRMAVINRKQDLAEFEADWRAACEKNFNSIWEFNAHKAGFSDRLHLLEGLKAINQNWSQTLSKTVDALKQNWESRLDRSAELLADLLEESILHVEKRSKRGKENDSALQEALLKDYRKELHKKEDRIRGELRDVFRHTRWDGLTEGLELVNQDLFCQEVAAALGLSRKQLTWVGGLSGAAIGGGLDIAVGGASLLAGTGLGGLIGGTLGYFATGTLPDVKVGPMSLGSRQLTVGPNKNLNFPFILADRYFMYFERVVSWAHGRRDYESADADGTASATSSGAQEHFSRDVLNKEEKKAFEALRRGILDGKIEEPRAAFIQAVKTVLWRILED